MKTPHENAGIKILVVEDSRTQAEYLSHILEQEGYCVALAANGDDALEQISVDRPELVLTDILMPGMDGFALCRAIKKNGNMADIPVILVTQLFDPADLIKGLDAGADNIIIKPFEASHVKARITSTLQSRVHPDSDGTEAPDMSSDGRMPGVPSTQLRTPAILLTTYELVVRKNAELQEAHACLTAANEELLRTVEKLQQVNENLLKENAGLKKMR